MAKLIAMAEGKTAGFHLSSLYSPVGWRSWRDIAAAWEAAVNKESGSAAAIKTFKNTELGETWVEEGEAPDWQRLLERREDYRIGSVPAGGLLLTASFGWNWPTLDEAAGAKTPMGADLDAGLTVPAELGRWRA